MICFVKKILAANLVWLMLAATPGYASANDAQKLQEICKAAIEAVDAGWAAFGLLENDLNKISINGRACTNRETAWPKCESTLQKLISNNLEPRLMQYFAEARIGKLKKLCDKVIYDDNAKLAISPRTWKEYALVDDDISELSKKGFYVFSTAIFIAENLPAGTKLSIETENLVGSGMTSPKYSCMAISVELLEFYGGEAVDLQRLDQFPVRSICFDLTRQVDSNLNAKKLERLLRIDR